MSIRGRIGRLIRAKRADDQPSSMQTVEDAHRRQLEAYEKARRSTADLAATHRKLEVLCSEAKAELEDLNRQAEEAVAAGDDDAARHALRSSLSTKQRLEQLTAQRHDAGGQLGRLQDDLDRIASRVADQQLHYHHLTARHGVSEATGSMQRAVAASTQAASEAADAARTAEREDRRTRHLDAAKEEITGTNPGFSDFESEFQELEAASDVESQLARLKETEEPPQPAGGSSPGR
ncbi:PspA/IM30 family protein [Arthrobacter sp. H14]|uniref:PspA/IM30 family protein n=1 Tax=Arthrobacter sp. H14 TaxID=1312959 RepID=UPI00047E16DA|nr:PspA/IM30 family protein [Arthrobacter sp. H14]